MKDTKIEKINAVKVMLTEHLHHKDAFVKNIGKMFFINKMDACVMRSLVYSRSRELGIEFELLSLDWRYFVGTKEKAMALKDAYGGTVEKTEYSYYVENSRDLYTWEAPSGMDPMEYDEVVDILFS